jgi:hypothetical protein
LALVAGCGTVPELTPIARPEVTVVAVAGARFEPVAKVDNLKRDPLASAAEGAVVGGVSGAALAGLSAAAVTVATANPYGAALILMSVAVGAVGEGAHGGVFGASAAEQGRRMHDAASTAATSEQLLTLQTAFAEEAAASLGRKAGRPVPVADIAPSSPEAIADYRSPTRVTEWSGAYNVYNVQVDPSRWRRGEYQAPMMRQDRFFHPLPGMQPDWFYYPMRAPTAHGADDCGN